MKQVWCPSARFPDMNRNNFYSLAANLRNKSDSKQTVFILTSYTKKTPQHFKKGTTKYLTFHES